MKIQLDMAEMVAWEVRVVVAAVRQPAKDRPGRRAFRQLKFAESLAK